MKLRQGQRRRREEAQDAGRDSNDTHLKLEQTEFCHPSVLVLLFPLLFPHFSEMSSLLKEEMQRVLFRPKKQKLLEFIEIEEKRSGRHFLCVSGKTPEFASALYMWIILDMSWHFRIIIQWRNSLSYFSNLEPTFMANTRINAAWVFVLDLLMKNN